MRTLPSKLVVFGASNILSDIFDAALSVGLPLKKIVLHEPEPSTPRSLSLSRRIEQFSQIATPPEVISFDAFTPGEDEVYLLGPTTPTRQRLAVDIETRWQLQYTILIHSTAYVSPLAHLSEGVFVGANSVVAPGTHLHPHVFINRGATIGHDNVIASYTRVQPGANLGGLSQIGTGVTIGIGATLLERLHIGDGAVIAGGSVVLNDVPSNVMVAGTPATVRKQLRALP